MLMNGDLAYCKDCGECSKVWVDIDREVYCALCESYDLLDMSDGSKFVPEFGEIQL